jgi:hypothetical protein
LLVEAPQLFLKSLGQGKVTLQQVHDVGAKRPTVASPDNHEDRVSLAETLATSLGLGAFGLGVLAHGVGILGHECGRYNV